MAKQMADDRRCALSSHCFGHSYCPRWGMFPCLVRKSGRRMVRLCQDWHPRSKLPCMKIANSLCTEALSSVAKCDACILAKCIIGIRRMPLLSRRNRLMGWTAPFVWAQCSGDIRCFPNAIGLLLKIREDRVLVCASPVSREEPFRLRC